MVNDVILSIEAFSTQDKGKLGDLFDSMNNDRANDRANKKALEAFMLGALDRTRFIDFCYQSWIYTCHLNGAFVGFGLLNAFKGKSAFFHFCMIGAQEHTADFGRLIFHNIFRSGHITTLLGSTPKCYRHVFPVLQSVGFELVDVIEDYELVNGKLRTSVFSKLTKERFNQHNKEFINGWKQ